MKLQKFGRQLLAATLLVTAAAGMSAATYRGIELTKTDNSTVKIALAQDLETTVSAEGNLVFAKGAEQVLSVPVAQVANWKFTEQAGTTAVDRVAEAAGCALLGNRVVIEGLTAPTVVRVIAANGQTVAETTATGRCELSLENLAAGVYVIAYGNQTLKIAVK